MPRNIYKKNYNPDIFRTLKKDKKCFLSRMLRLEMLLHNTFEDWPNVAYKTGCL